MTRAAIKCCGPTVQVQVPPDSSGQLMDLLMVKNVIQAIRGLSFGDPVGCVLNDSNTSLMAWPVVGGYRMDVFNCNKNDIRSAFAPDLDTLAGFMAQHMIRV